MRIQNLLLPKMGVCANEPMFYRVEREQQDDVQIMDEEDQLVFAKFGRCVFDTYFNSLTVDKWKKYTVIGAVSLVLNLKGCFEVTLLRSELVDSVKHMTVLDRKIVHAKELESFSFPYPIYETHGLLSFSLKALENDSIYAGGGYDADVKEELLQDVNIALNICTFKREPFILRNIGILKSEILDNPNHPMHGHFRVYISDNGKTLPLDEINCDSIRIVQNKNAGGAGGFGRGLIEILTHQNEFPATHALMMDDDVVIETESLFRTFMLLRSRKACYQDACVGGAMLKLDSPNIQVESGAFWNAGNLHSNKTNLNMEDPYHCALNEIEEYTEFNAWWYCCTPMSVVTEDNLPMPIFIRGDDVEYGLRNMKTLILLNGICVWHEAFENKYSSFLSYYILRNLCYDNARHAENFGARQAVSRMIRSVARELVYYRYKNVNLIFRAVNDFLKGTEFLLNTDAEVLHKEIMASGYQNKTLEDLGEQFTMDAYNFSKNQNETRAHRIMRFITFNGYLLPAKRGTTIVPMAQCRPINFFRRKRVLNYDPSSGKAFVTEMSRVQTIAAIFRCIGMSVKILVKFPKAQKKFKEESKQLTTMNFWSSYLAE